MPFRIFFGGISIITGTKYGDCINNKNPYIEVQKSNLETILKIEFMKLTQFQLVYMRNTKIANQEKKFLNY